MDALEEDLGQSFTICPAFPQNIQSLLSKQHFHSSAVSLPSLPNFDKVSDLGVEVLVDFSLDLLESLEELELFLEEENAEGFLEDLEDVVEGLLKGFAWQLISDLWSQWCTSIAWIRVWSL